MAARGAKCNFAAAPKTAASTNPYTHTHTHKETGRLGGCSILLCTPLHTSCSTGWLLRAASCALLPHPRAPYQVPFFMQCWRQRQRRRRRFVKPRSYPWSPEHIVLALAADGVLVLGCLWSFRGRWGGRAKVPSYSFLSHMQSWDPGPHKSQSKQRAASQLDGGFGIPRRVGFVFVLGARKSGFVPSMHSKNINIVEVIVEVIFKFLL